MIFLQPLLLVALLTLPLILVLHLLRERRRRAVVPSLLHWLNLPRLREGEHMRRLPLTLLLLLHLLAAALLGLALGRPQLQLGYASDGEQLALIVDTSSSMAAREGGSTRLAAAQQRARAVLRGLAEGDRVTLISAGPRARTIARGDAADLPTLQAALQQLQPGGTGTDLAAALTLADASFAAQQAGRILVISDGALPSVSLPPTRARVEWQQIGSEQPNRAIVAFAVRRWGANLQVYARIANYDSAPFATTLWLYGDEQSIGTRDVRLSANGEMELTWTVRATYQTLRAELDGRDALALDDQAFLNAAAVRPLKVLLVSATPDALRRALSAVPGVSVTTVGPSDYGSAQQADLTVFDSYLPAAWPTGPVLVVNPPVGSELLAVGGSVTLDANELTQSGAVLEGLSFAGVNFGEVREVTAPDWAETLLAAEDAAVPLIMRGRSQGHQIAVWTFDLASSNLPARLAFPLLVARTVRDLAPAPLPSSIASGAELPLQPDARATEVVVTGPNGEQATLGVTSSQRLEELVQPGLYRIEERRAQRLLYAGQVGVNAGAAGESDLRPRYAPQRDAPVVAAAGARRQALELWPWLALAAVVVLLVEWMYLHR